MLFPVSKTILRTSTKHIILTTSNILHQRKSRRAQISRPTAQVGNTTRRPSCRHNHTRITHAIIARHRRGRREQGIGRARGEEFTGAVGLAALRVFAASREGIGEIAAAEIGDWIATGLVSTVASATMCMCMMLFYILMRRSC